jgi:hypothetical protein
MEETMAETNQTGDEGRVRVPDPAGAEQDPANLDRQRQIERDRDALKAQADRVKATVPPEVRDRTVGEITAEANRRAEEDRAR